MTPKRSEQQHQRQLAAIHESGHCVVWLARGQPMSFNEYGVTLNPPPPRDSLSGDWCYRFAGSWQAHDLAVATLSGFIAERTFDPESPPYYGTQDRRDVAKLIARYRLATMNELKTEARDNVRRFWDIIQGFALELLEHETLSGYQCESIFQKLVLLHQHISALSPQSRFPESMKPKLKKSTGRPSVRTEATAKRLCESIGRGAPFVYACAVAGLSASAFHAWKAEDEAFRLRVERAVALGVNERLATIEKAARHGDFRAAAWLLEHCQPQHFAKSRLEISGADGAPLAAGIQLYLPKKNGEGAVVGTEARPALTEEISNGDGN